MKKAAFTTIEMVIVLGITAVIFSLVGPRIVTTQERLAEQHFWHQFRQEWRYAQMQAQTNHYGTTIHYAPEKSGIAFTCNFKQQVVTVPPTLQVVAFSDIEIKGDGYVRPQTQEFYSKITNEKYLLVIQMARGEYYVKKVASVRNGR